MAVTTGESLQIRIHGGADLPTLIYLPGLHGDWTLVGGFRAAVLGRARFVEFTYPRRTDWSLPDYADAIAAALLAHGITTGWVLAESFGSQVGWMLLARAQQFRATGVILAGGFVRHPAIWGVHLVQWLNYRLPLKMLMSILGTYVRLAKARQTPGTDAASAYDAFYRARNSEPDRRAIASRYTLIAENDLRPIARQATLPVYNLTGLFDYVILWPFVQRWVRRNCPGYRGWKLIRSADHGVLSTTPQISAQQVLEWIAMTRPG